MYSPSFSFVAIAAIILLLCFVIFSAYNSSINAIIVGIRVSIKVVIGLKKLGLKLRLSQVYKVIVIISFTVIRVTISS